MLLGERLLNRYGEILVGGYAMTAGGLVLLVAILLANPVSRTSMVLQKIWAMVVFAVIVGISAFAGTAAGSVVGRLGIDMSNILSASAMAVLLGLTFGGIALLLGGASGRTDVAIYGSTGIAVVSFIANGFLTVNEATEGWAVLSPFYHYLGSEPLLNGMPWGNALVLLAVAVATAALGIALFNRRDLRARG